MGYLTAVPLFDGDLTAVWCLQIDGGKGRGDIERETMLTGQHRDRIRTDLIGRIAVGGNTVGTDDHAVDLS